MTLFQEGNTVSNNKLIFPVKPNTSIPTNIIKLFKHLPKTGDFTDWFVITVLYNA
jgi:hypothetical protein